MTFTGLEQRFNEKVNQLYAGAKNKFDNGKATMGKTDEPFIVRRPGEGQPGIKLESQGFPVASTLQDAKRLTLFQISKRGLLFLAKQQLLQTGNTFEHTRVINPLFVVANAVPFLHVRRQLRPLTVSSLLGGGAIVNKLFGSGAQQTDVKSLRKIGQLQQETYNKVTQGINASSLLKKIPVIGPTISAFSAKRSMGEVGDYENSRPELSNLNLTGLFNALRGSTINSGYIVGRQRLALRGWNDKMTVPAVQKYGANLKTYNTYLKRTDGESKWVPDFVSTDYITKFSKTITGGMAAFRAAVNVNEPDMVEDESAPTRTSLLATTDTEIRISYDKFIKPIIDKQALVAFNIIPASAADAITDEEPKFLKYFTADDASITGIGMLSEPGESNAKTLAVESRKTGKKISYIKDPSNKMLDYVPNSNPYNQINTNEDMATGGWDDPITVSFAMGKDEPVRFRAFITDLQQRATPQYNAKQYIGRMEKFITYTGVQREISFTLNIIAFSKDEIDGVWTRINYLTGLVFPYGFNKGIMQPNITRLTIGKVYDNQPGYITALDTNFKDVSESWDIDRKVPIAATMRMSFTLIEKATKIATSPFYGITETGLNFNKQIPTAGKNAAESSTATPTTSVPQEYDVVERNLINAYNVAVQRGATQREINAIMQRLGEYRDNRLFPNRPRPQP